MRNPGKPGFRFSSPEGVGSSELDQLPMITPAGITETTLSKNLHLVQTVRANSPLQVGSQLGQSVSQLATQDLAGRCPGKLGNESDHPRNLMGSQAGSDQPLEFACQGW